MCEKPKDPGKSDLQGSDEKQNNEPNQNPSVSRRRFFGILGGAVSAPQVGSVHQTASVAKQTLSPAIKFALDFAKTPQAKMFFGSEIDFSGLLYLAGLKQNSLRNYIQESFLTPDAFQRDDDSAHRLRRAIESLHLAAGDGQYAKMSLREFFTGDFYDDSPALQELRKVGATLDKIADGFDISPDLPLEDTARDLTNVWNEQIFKLIESSNSDFNESMQLVLQYIPTGNEQESRIRHLYHILLQRKRESILKKAVELLESARQSSTKAKYHIACSGDDFVLQPFDLRHTSLESLIDLHPLNIVFWAIRKRAWFEIRSWKSFIKIKRLPLADRFDAWQYMVKIKDHKLHRALCTASSKGKLKVPIIPHQVNAKTIGKLTFNDLAPFLQARAHFDFEKFSTFFEDGAMNISVLA